MPAGEVQGGVEEEEEDESRDKMNEDSLSRLFDEKHKGEDKE